MTLEDIRMEDTLQSNGFQTLAEWAASVGVNQFYARRLCRTGRLVGSSVKILNQWWIKKDATCPVVPRGRPKTKKDKEVHIYCDIPVESLRSALEELIGPNRLKITEIKITDTMDRDGNK